MEQKTLTQQQKAISLFEFIRELNKLKQKLVLNMREHPLCRPLGELPPDPEHIRLQYRDRVEEDAAETDQVLLSVRKPQFERCPQPEAVLDGWLVEGWDSWRNEVQTHACLARTGAREEDQVLEWFSDSPQRTEALERWQAQRARWAERQQLREQTMELFTDLYKRYFELERDPETLELIVASGVLMDKHNSGIRHPVLTKRVKLRFDPEENTISVEEVDGQSELYSVVFQTMDDVNLSAVNQLQDELRRHDYHPLDRNETPGFLKVLVHQLSSDSVFSADGVPEDWKKQARLLMTVEPCLILRRRLDGTPKAIERIIRHIQDTDFVPAPICDIVSGGRSEMPEDLEEQTLEQQLAAVGGEDPDIFLSKEANSEQLQIAKRIDRSNAVLVQGPPGTGKTHTIANLMGHFLAQGLSVLVTSHTPKALSVLKDKIPQGLQNLCVSVLEDSNADMERSIDGIAEYMSRTTSHELKRDMELLAEERLHIIDQLAQIRKKLFRVIHQECSSISWQGEALSPTAAARFVLERQEELDYIPGRVDETLPLPLSRAELVELYRSNEELTPADERELAVELPRREELLAPVELQKLLDSLASAQEVLHSLHKNQSWEVWDYASEERLTLKNGPRTFDMDAPDRTALELLRDTCAAFGQVQPWMKCAAVDGREDGPYRRRWETLVEQIRSTCARSAAVTEERFGHDMETGGGTYETMKAPLEKLRDIFAEKKKVSKLTLMFHKDCEKVMQTVRYDGHPLASAEECAAVLHLLELEEARRVCGRYWEELLVPHGVMAFRELDLREPERTALNWTGVIERCLNWYRDAYTPLRERLSAAQIPEQAVFQITELDSRLTATDKILAAVSRDIPAICALALAVLDIRDYEGRLDEAKHTLQAGGRVASDLCAQAAEAIDAQDAARYADACGELERMCDKYALRQRRRELLSRVMTAAPQWAEDIRRRKGIHGQGLLPDTIEEAWKWKQLAQIVEGIVAEPYAKLQADSSAYSRRYRQATAAYAEKAAWYHLMRRTEGDKSMQQALFGWKQTIKKIGKGTGRNAPALKAKARELMSRCQEAVPGWIMPISRALDNLDPRRNSFDIIIIDEASQSDVSSLAILYMGKKLIIVGDDKQVSPMAVGVEVDKMNALQQMYIQGKIPNAHLYDAKTSIYDIARTTFQPLMLREHFRCVPQIIGFSNMLSYDDQIKPLREAGSSRLLPAVVNYRVEDGQREDKRKVNSAEAKAIVALMRGCMAQPEYDGKTFGVISLLGDDQVKRIQQEIERQLPSREILDRRILCGNASHFQGDERDVIFLSLVDSGTGSGPLHMMNYGVDDAARKRYNVAASRARDQLWVVDSLDSAADLKPGDIRKTLIDYSLDPEARSEKHRQAERQADSPFEAAVAKALIDRGYRLEQQRSVGAYRLDMVAVCGSRSVAIECDGERWHSGESKIREDMERQTILERLGWRFIRIRGSEYYRNPRKAMERLVRELEANGIRPEAAAPAEKPDTDLLARVKAHAQSLLTPEVPQEARSQAAAAALAPQKALPEAPEDLLVSYLKKRRIDCLDLRSQGGALWIIGGSELKPLVKQCEALGLHFHFQRGGTKLTKWKDAWWAD